MGARIRGESGPRRAAHAVTLIRGCSSANATEQHPHRKLDTSSPITTEILIGPKPPMISLLPQLGRGANVHVYRVHHPSIDREFPLMASLAKQYGNRARRDRDHSRHASHERTGYDELKLIQCLCAILRPGHDKQAVVRS